MLKLQTKEEYLRDIDNYLKGIQVAPYGPDRFIGVTANRSDILVRVTDIYTSPEACQKDIDRGHVDYLLNKLNHQGAHDHESTHK